MEPLLPRPEPLVERRFTALVQRLRWYGTRRWSAAGVVALVAVGIGWWALHPTALPVETHIPLTRPTPQPNPHGADQPSTVGGTTTSLHSPELVVDVAGAVQQPGLYRLARGARVFDAIQAAHGATPDANTDAVNLARPLADGERVFVPRNGEPAASDSADTPVVVHINSASASELDALPGVGPTTAAAIVAYRTAHGPFASVDELASVKGIGASKLDLIRALVDL